MMPLWFTVVATLAYVLAGAFCVFVTWPAIREQIKFIRETRAAMDENRIHMRETVVQVKSVVERLELALRDVTPESIAKSKENFRRAASAVKRFDHMLEHMGFRNGESK